MRGLRLSSLVLGLGLLGLSLRVARGEEPRAVRDETGVAWVLPFRKAAAQADEAGRLLLIKPIAFGTEADGGW